MSTPLPVLPSADASHNGLGAPPARATTIAIMAMGGEGGGVLADWIVDLAEHDGYFAQTTSVPGVAQRTGATIYYIEIFPAGPSGDGGPQPVLALMPVPGEVDIVVASELMEAGRAVQRGLVSADRTTLIASTNRVYSMTERTALADGRVDSTALLEAGRASARRFIAADFAALAEHARSVISASLFGALAASEALPFSRTACEEAIRRGGVGVASSLEAFAAGYTAAQSPTTTLGTPAAGNGAATGRIPVGPRLQSLAARIGSSFPPAVHDVLDAAIVRLADYQDVRYAAEYLDRLEPVRDADSGAPIYALLRETARHLALWMTYEDAIRVADLKIRRSRFDRVRGEVRATDAQLVAIREYLHPRLDELTDIMPRGLGALVRGTRPIRSLVERATRRGQVLTTTSLTGFLQLYTLAGLRRWRRGSLRFRREQDAIEDWLALLPPLARVRYDLAVAVAECPRLIKGYGDTHERGETSFTAVMNALPALRDRPDAAAAVRKLCRAALQDDTGDALRGALGTLGLPSAVAEPATARGMP